MKRMVLVFSVIIVAVGLISCAAPMRYSQPIARSTSYQPPTQTTQRPAIVGGLVPVDIQNPSPLEQEVIIFWGSDRVDVVPDPRTGGLMYSRPAATKSFRVGGANSANNWHNYVTITLPRNSSFILAGQTENFWGKSSPYFVYFSTGSTPFSYRYNRVMPSYLPAEAGGLVTLQHRPIMPFGPGPLQIEYIIDTQAIGLSGRPIAREITNKIYGR